jgi:hypothetical protein
MEQRLSAEQAWKQNFHFRLMWNFCFIIVMHDQSSMPNMGPCQMEPPKQPISYSTLHRVIAPAFYNKLVNFPWVSWVFLHDSRSPTVLAIIYFLSVSAPYSFHICFRQYLFLGFLYSFPLRLFPSILSLFTNYGIKEVGKIFKTQSRLFSRSKSCNSLWFGKGRRAMYAILTSN